MLRTTKDIESALSDLLFHNTGLDKKAQLRDRNEVIDKIDFNRRNVSDFSPHFNFRLIFLKKVTYRNMAMGQRMVIGTWSKQKLATHRKSGEAAHIFLPAGN